MICRPEPAHAQVPRWVPPVTRNHYTTLTRGGPKGPDLARARVPYGAAPVLAGRSQAGAAGAPCAAHPRIAVPPQRSKCHVPCYTCPTVLTAKCTVECAYNLSTWLHAGHLAAQVHAKRARLGVACGMGSAPEEQRHFTMRRPRAKKGGGCCCRLQEPGMRRRAWGGRGRRRARHDRVR